MENKHLHCRNSYKTQNNKETEASTISAITRGIGKRVTQSHRGHWLCNVSLSPPYRCTVQKECVPRPLVRSWISMGEGPQQCPSMTLTPSEISLSADIKVSSSALSCCFLQGLFWHTRPLLRGATWAHEHAYALDLKRPSKSYSALFWAI